jgi:hypothetical protein
VPNATSRKRLVGTFEHPNIMNTPNTPTPDLESLRKAIQEYQPNPRRIPFSNLKPLHDSIVELRGKKASYAIIAELLQRSGVKTSRARVAEYGRIVLESGRSRKRRKRTKNVPAAGAMVTSQNPPAEATKPAPATTAPAAAITSNVPPPPKNNSGYVSRGPHIANVRMMSAQEAKEFDASLTPRSAPKP